MIILIKFFKYAQKESLKCCIFLPVNFVMYGAFKNQCRFKIVVGYGRYFVILPSLQLGEVGAWAEEVSDLLVVME